MQKIMLASQEPKNKATLSFLTKAKHATVITLKTKYYVELICIELTHEIVQNERNIDLALVNPSSLF